MKSILELKGNDYIVCDNIIEAMALEKCLNKEVQIKEFAQHNQLFSS